MLGLNLCFKVLSNPISSNLLLSFDNNNIKHTALIHVNDRTRFKVQFLLVPYLYVFRGSAFSGKPCSICHHAYGTNWQITESAWYFLQAM